METALLEALARQSRAESAGEPPVAAFVPLARALSIAEPEGYVTLFAAEGSPLARLLQAYGAAHPDSLLETPYGRRLRQALGLSTDPHEGPAHPAGVSAPSILIRPSLPGGEALSDRELEVLRAIASGLSNADAARRLYLSPFTVKKHLENIYGKLGVHNRTEAIVQAQRLGLLTLGA
jgi:LuxR family maltose regulon positive regulatory protein